MLLTPFWGKRYQFRNRRLHFMFKKLIAFYTMEAEPRGLFCQAAVVLPLTWAGLHLFGINRTAIWLERWADGLCPPTPPSDPKLYVQRARQALYLAIEYGLDRGKRDKICLRRALVMRWLLRKQGIARTLHFGVGRDRDNEFMAHAWLNYQGTCLVGGRKAPPFTPFAQAIEPIRRRA
jgi:hypothetical protein